MQQKIQFIATVMHDPKLLILDEPFSGLDPINTNLIKDEIHQLNQQGTSIIFSTHRMEQVEEICNKIVLINKGKKVIEGDVAQIKEDYKENVFSLKYGGQAPQLNDTSVYKIVADKDNELHLKINDGYQSNDLLSALMQSGVEIRSFNEILPTINDIFIREVGISNE